MKVKKKIQLLKVLASTSYILGVASLITALVYSLSPAMPTFAQSGAGAIWTTSNTCGAPQNVNQYAVGETIYINGANFTAGESLPWDITRVSGGSEKPTVASGSVTVDSGGAFCFSAYLIQASDAGYTYQATVGTVKSDNFRVAAADPTATFTPSSTPTDTPTNTPVPSSTPTDTPTNTPVPSSTPTDTPTATPTNTTESPPDPTDTPVPTATDTPTSTPEDPGSSSDPTSTPTPTATSVPPTATPGNPGPAPTQTISATDLVTDPGLLIPVTGADSVGGPLSRTTLFKNLGVFLFGFGLVLHGLYLQAKKSK
jgi:hypothetical protein